MTENKVGRRFRSACVALNRLVNVVKVIASVEWARSLLNFRTTLLLLLVYYPGGIYG